MLIDLLKANTTSTGTGSLTMTRSGSNPMPSDHPLLSTVNGVEIGYSIKNAAGIVVETGIGTINSNGTVLARTYVHMTWNPSTTAMTTGRNISAFTLVDSSHTIEFGLNGANAKGDLPVRDAATMKINFPDYMTAITSSTISMTAYTVYYILINIKSLTTAAGFVVRHSGVTQPNYVFGLHQRKANGNPGPTIYSSTSAQITTTEGVNTFAFTGGNKLIPAGQYFISMCCDATDTLWRTGGATGFPPQTLGSNATNNFQTVNYLTETITAPLAIPPNHGTLTQVYTSYIPVVGIVDA